MDDYISRQMAIKAFETAAKSGASIEDIKLILAEMPSAQPELDIWNDGTLHISVSKGQLDKIGRVLVEENGTIFCKLFYQDAEPERKTGRWIPSDSELEIKCNKCGKSFSDYVNAGTEYIFLEEIPNFCPNCGIRIKRGE